MKTLKKKENNLTIYSIAELANVSKTTVSRYLNEQYEYMSEDTKNRIKKIIDDNHYQPSNVARSLKSKNTKLLGVVISDIENPFSAPTIKSMNQKVLDANHHMIVSSANNHLEQEKSIVESLVKQRVDAILINPVSYEGIYLLEISKRVPVILLDRTIKGSHLDIVYSDNHQPVIDMMDFLKKQGYQKIYLFTEAYETISTRKQRFITFIDYLKAHQVDQPESYVRVIDRYHSNEISRMIQEILKKHPHEPAAIFASNGPTLMKVALELKKMNISTPDQIGLCGYDDFGSVTEMGWAELSSVTLTTLAPDWISLGSTAVDLALERISNPDLKQQSIAVSVKLFPRESTNLVKKI